MHKIIQDNQHKCWRKSKKFIVDVMSMVTRNKLSIATPNVAKYARCRHTFTKHIYFSKCCSGKKIFFSSSFFSISSDIGWCASHNIILVGGVSHTILDTFCHAIQCKDTLGVHVHVQCLKTIKTIKCSLSISVHLELLALLSAFDVYIYAKS